MIEKLVLIVSFFMLSTPLAAENRTALVIGNSNYDAAPLKNPANDAHDIAKALRALGFEVIEKINVDQQQMEEAIVTFGRTLEKKQGVGLLYYAGHGIQSKGQNYLLPVGAVVNRETELRYKAVNASRILDEMGYANNGLNIAILDACRNNPLTRSFRNSARGLARIDNAPKGLFLAYSTDPGNVALDGDGRNSPFTAELLKAIHTKGLPIEQVFKQVRRNVETQSRGKQTPFTTSSLSGDFYFVAPDNVPNDSQANSNVFYESSNDLRSIENEDQFWNQMSACGTKSCYEAYKHTYPQGRYVVAANALLESLRGKAAPLIANITATNPGESSKQVEKDQGFRVLINETIQLNRFGKVQFPEGGVGNWRWGCIVET
jgi:hypothetical protein